MKTLLLSTILFLPCLLVLNESETLIPNLVGITYIIALFVLSRKSERIKQLFIDTENELNYITDKIMK